MLEKHQVHEYWEQRVGKHGVRAVGFGNRSLDFQSKICEQRVKFIFPHCPRSLRTLDFGCGTGNFTGYFKSYLGVDINKNLLSFAKKAYPRKKFILLRQPIPLERKIISFKPELFFSATVLQHNSDDLIRKIFKSMAQIGQEMIFSIYENCLPINKYHMKGRMPEEYLAFLRESFKILISDSFCHSVHGEEHGLTIAMVRPL